MVLAKNLFLFFVLHLVLLLHSADSNCQESFHCGKLGSLEFPLSNMKPDCGLLMVDKCDSENPVIQVGDGRFRFEILEKISANKLLIRDAVLQEYLTDQTCFPIENLTLPKSPSISFTTTPNLTLFTCLRRFFNDQTRDYFENYNNKTCDFFTVFYRNPGTGAPATGETGLPQGCSVVQLPMNPNHDSAELYDILSAEFYLEWNISEACYKCHHGGRQCLSNTLNEFECKKEKNRLALILATVALMFGAQLYLEVESSLFYAY